MTNGRFRKLVLAIVLVAIALLSSTILAPAALARPCCTDCWSWPDLDPYNDPCARVCLFSC